MRRFIVFLFLIVLPGIACTFNVQMQPQSEVHPEVQDPSPVPATEGNLPGAGQVLQGPNIDYKGIRFILDPTLGSRLYVYDDSMTIDGATAHQTRFALNPEEYCQTWCLMLYPVAEFKQAFGSFVFPPNGYRGGAAVVFKAQEATLDFQNGNGERTLETFGQDHYGVSNESLHYVFRGYSADGQYGVFVQIPIRVASLPDAAPTIATNVDEILKYNQRVAESMTALGPEDFAPNLSLLDALVTSIRLTAP